MLKTKQIIKKIKFYLSFSGIGTLKASFFNARKLEKVKRLFSTIFIVSRRTIKAKASRFFLSWSSCRDLIWFKIVNNFFNNMLFSTFHKPFFKWYWCTFWFYYNTYPQSKINGGKSGGDGWFATLNAFYHIWPWYQWVWSLISLVVLYIVTGHYYNKWLIKTTRGQWLSFRMRLLLIVFDLVINLSLGLYYMNHRDTTMGKIMIRCPIAISPLIFIGELICVSVYYVYYYYLPRRPWWINFWLKMDKNKYWNKVQKISALWKRIKLNDWHKFKKKQMGFQTGFKQELRVLCKKYIRRFMNRRYWAQSEEDYRIKIRAMDLKYYPLFEEKTNQLLLVQKSLLEHKTIINLVDTFFLEKSIVSLRLLENQLFFWIEKNELIDREILNIMVEQLYMCTYAGDRGNIFDCRFINGLASEWKNLLYEWTQLSNLLVDMKSSLLRSREASLFLDKNTLLLYKKNNDLLVKIFIEIMQRYIMSRLKASYKDVTVKYLGEFVRDEERLILSLVNNFLPKLSEKTDLFLAMQDCIKSIILEPTSAEKKSST